MVATAALYCVGTCASLEEFVAQLRGHGNDGYALHSWNFTDPGHSHELVAVFMRVEPVTISPAHIDATTANVGQGVVEEMRVKRVQAKRGGRRE